MGLLSKWKTQKIILFFFLILLPLEVYSQSRKELVDSATHYMNLGKYDKALELAQKALKISETEYGKESEAYCKSLDLIADIHFLSNNCEKAIEYYNLSKEIKAKVLGKNHQSYAKTLNNLSNCLQKTNKLREAEQILLETLEIKKQLFGTEDSSYAISLNNLGKIYIELADYEKAEQINLQALEIKRKQLPENHPSIARTLVNLTAIYQKLGDYNKALECIREATNIFISTLGENNAETIEAKLLLSRLLYKTNNTNEALKILQSIKLEQRNEQSNADYASMLFLTGIIYWENGDSKKAEELMLKAMSIIEDNPPLQLYVDILNALGVVYHSQNKFDLAYKYLIQALKIREQYFDENHPDYTSTLHNFAGVLNSLGQYEKAEQYYKKVFSQYITQIKRYFPFLSEKEKAQFYYYLRNRFNIFNFFVLQRLQDNPSLVGDMYNYQIATKGILLSNSIKIRQTILESNNPEIIRKYNRWQDLMNQLSYLYTLSTFELKQQEKNIKNIEAEVNSIEKELSKFSNLFEKEYTKKEYTWKDIQKTLKPDEACIEIIRISTNKGENDTTIYAFLILTAETKNQPEIVVLYNGEQLEKLYIRGYRNRIYHQIEDDSSYHYFWQKVDQKIKDKKTIYISQDGIYFQINLNTLKNPDGKYLIQEKNFIVVTNTKELLETKPKPKTSNTIALIGNPNFNLNTQQSSNIKKKIPPLPWTLVEIENIQNQFSLFNWQSTVLKNQDASEKRIKELSQFKFIHIATHGFFEEDTKIKFDPLQIDFKSAKKVENPLFKSYLLLAGAENTLNAIDKIENPNDDGVLTAFEVMSLNLENCELVVLSACETGLGVIQNGEGVYGLQRAFRIAGVKSIIMSLWEVDDKYTQMLMNELYANYLQGKSIREALKLAQLKILENPESSEPYYWGAFVLIGDI